MTQGHWFYLIQEKNQYVAGSGCRCLPFHCDYLLFLVLEMEHVSRVG